MGQQLRAGALNAAAEAEPASSLRREHAFGDFLASETKDTPDAAWVVLASESNVSPGRSVSQGSVQHLKTLEDLSLIGRVGCALHSTGYVTLRAVAISVGNRFVVLSGRVPTYYMKQVAQEAALKVPGVHGVRNDLDVSLLL